MLKFDAQFLRRGGNQLGVLIMASGLVAYFVDAALRNWMARNNIKITQINYDESATGRPVC